MKKRNKILGMLIMAILAINSLGISAFAESNDNITVEDNEINTVTEDVDILTEDLEKGNSKPDKYKNLSTGAYSFKGEYKVRIFSNYHFSPNSNNKLIISATTKWPSDYSIQKQMTVNLHEYSTGKIVRTAKASTSENSSTGGYNNIASTGRVTFYNLDPDEFYYLECTKTTDQEIASISGYVEW